MKNIAVIYGGYSSEFDISVKSGKNVVQNIDRTNYNVFEVELSKAGWRVIVEGNSYEIDKTDFSFTCDGKKTTFDKVMIMIHGCPGENGQLQAYFEMIGMPYVGCKWLVSAITFDKYACKMYLKEINVKMAKDLFLRQGDKYSVDEIVSHLGLPVFVKPNNGGSSFGVSKVKRAEDLNKAITEAFSQGDTLIIEKAIVGHELDCCVYMDREGEVHALPVIEIISKNEYFDYEAKYLGASNEICPAQIPDKMRDEVQQAAVDIFCRLGCTGFVRMDFISNDEGAYFLEVNPVPGMTAQSLVPQELREAGIEVKDFLTMLLES